jgi:hypothetical protein
LFRFIHHFFFYNVEFSLIAPNVGAATTNIRIFLRSPGHIVLWFVKAIPAKIPTKQRHQSRPKRFAQLLEWKSTDNEDRMCTSLGVLHVFCSLLEQRTLPFIFQVALAEVTGGEMIISVEFLCTDDLLFSWWVFFLLFGWTVGGTCLCDRRLKV